MKEKKPRKKRFNLFDEEFGAESEAPLAPTFAVSESETSKRVRIRQAIVDVPLDGKIEIIRAESNSDAEFRALISSLVGNPDEIIGKQALRDESAKKSKTAGEAFDEDVSRGKVPLGKKVNRKSRPANKAQVETASTSNFENQSQEASRPPTVTLDVDGPSSNLGLAVAMAEPKKPGSNIVQNQFESGSIVLDELGADPHRVCQTEQKSSSNIVQRKDEDSFNPGSNLVQNLIEPSSNMVQISVKPSSKPSSVSGSLTVQTSVKTSSQFDLHRYSPIQQKLLLFLAQQCQISRSESSPPLNGAILSSRLECTLEGLRTAVKRLVAKDVLEIAEVKIGKNGWTKYRLPDHVFQALLIDASWFNSGSNVVQNQFKSSPKSSSESSSSGSSSRSSLISSKEKELTTSKPQMGEAWLAIQTPEHLKRMGFGLVQIRQIFEANILSAEELQTSLDHFAFELQQGLSPRTSPINYLMGILLKKGVPYYSVEYRNAQQKEIDDYMAQLQKVNLANQAISEQRKEIEFETWLKALSDDEKRALVPPTLAAPFGHPLHKQLLKSHFSEHVFQPTGGLLK